MPRGLIVLLALGCGSAADGALDTEVTEPTVSSGAELAPEARAILESGEWQPLAPELRAQIEAARRDAGLPPAPLE